ncbi:MAG: DUF3783 domain-containing protein [Longicatena sp.]
MEKIAFYGGTQGDEEKILDVITKQGMKALPIHDEDLFQSVGAIFGYEGFEKEDSSGEITGLDDAFMILDGVSDEQITSLNQALKEANIAFVGAKAMVTQHNKEWRLLDLFKEIQSEHAYFKAYAAFKVTLLEVNQFQQANYTPESWVIFQGAMLEAYLTYQAQTGDTQEIIEAHQQLQTAIQQLVKLSA